MSDIIIQLARAYMPDKKSRLEGYLMILPDGEKFFFTISYGFNSSCFKLFLKMFLYHMSVLNIISILKTDIRFFYQ